MMKKTRGMSEVVTTLIIILLTIVALGIIWVVVRGVVNKGVGQVDLATKCQEIEIHATKLVNSTNDGLSYNVTLSRTGAGDKVADGFGGEKVVIKNAAGDASQVLSFPDALDPLETKTEKLTLTNAVPNANTVEVKPFFLSDSNAEQLCSNTITDTF